MRIADILCGKMLITKAELLSFSHTAPRRYKKYYISKRNSVKKRLIAQPSREVKFLQRLVIDELRPHLEIHSCVMAYEKGVGIKANANKHKNSKYLLKMDFKNFFLSITPDLFFSVCSDCNIVFNQDDHDLLRHLLFWKLRRNSPLRLSIGAPSSPFLSNFVMCKFDLAIDDICREKNVTYTRYADDLTFTTNLKGVLFEIPSIVRDKLKLHCHSTIKVNAEKTVYSSKAFNRHITGVTITNDERLSVGREKKRLVSSMIHKFSLGELDIERTFRLKGLLAHLIDIEPDFNWRMQKKYGKDVLNKLFGS